MNPKYWICIAALSGAMAVAIGAYHAHGLAKRLTARGVEGEQFTKRMDNGEIAVRYQAVHSVALLAVAALAARTNQRRLYSWSQGLFVLGMTFFSGGLYLFTFTGQIGHWAIVPSGGLCLMLAWIVLAAAAITSGDAT